MILSSISSKAHLLNPAIKLDGEEISYQVFNKQIQEKAALFEESGIQEGNRVALIGKSDLFTIIAFFALLKIGASPLLLSSRIPSETLEKQIHEARASFFLEEHHIKKTGKYPYLPQNILLFTSGSSGKAKLACLTEKNFSVNAKGAIPFMQLSEESCYQLSVPLFHVSGLSILFRTFLSGGSVSLGPSPETSHLSFVPTQLLRFLEKKPLLPKLKAILLGGAAISEELLIRALKQNLPIQTTYGMTETASQITISSLSDPFTSLHLGKTSPGRRIKLAQDGEILVQGDILFSGYDTGREIVLDTTKDGFFPTGDLGQFTPEGNLVHTGRKDNLFISGGENIHPEEIEKALGRVPGVLIAIVVPKNDPEYGQRPVAFLHTQGSFPSKEELQEHLSSILPKFAIPDNFLPIPQKLINESKIKRSEIKNYIDLN